MRITPLPTPLQRVAFLGRPDFEPHAPRYMQGLQTRFFAVEAERWEAAIDAARHWGADASVVWRPQDVTPELAARLPGAMRVGIIPTPLFTPADWTRLARTSGPDVQGFRWLTYLESPPPPELSRLPLLQTLPPVVDTSRFIAGPQLERRRLLVVDWARPSPQVLEQLCERTRVEILPSDVTPERLSAALEETGVLVYSSRDALGRFDPLPLRAMAQGLLLIADTTFLADWYIEQEDEYLLRCEDDMVLAVDELLFRPEHFKAVRIRAWQKIREAFDASTCLQRMLHDAHLLADPLGHLAHLPRGGASTSGPDPLLPRAAAASSALQGRRSR